MKIGIITKIGKNFGAILQAYALKTCLENKGHDVHIIKYTPKNSQKTYKVCRYPWRYRGTIYNIKALMHYRAIKNSSKKIKKFREDYFDFIGEYKNESQINENPPICDIYITGSDQVWNPLISFDSAYYLDFVNDNNNVKRVSYAASIGLKEIPNEYINIFKERIKKFDYISVRENRAKEILNTFSIESKVAPDPTLVLPINEWNNISVKSKIEEPYILCYFISYNKEMKIIVDKLKEKLKYKVVNLMTSEESCQVGDIKIRNAGPKEFLGLFENASFILTSSFHGTVFSILNNKPFATILYKQTSSRVEELLKNINLEERIISPKEFEIKKYINEPKEIYTENILNLIKEQNQKGNEILEEIINLDHEK